jgi:predicted N-acetyltransferase YhbS
MRWTFERSGVEAPGVRIERRPVGAGDLRRLQDLCHELWRTDGARLNFETSFGTLAWEGIGVGRERVFERGGELVGWARLTPGYDRIRRMGVWDVAPPNLVWAVDWREPANVPVLRDIVEWAESRGDEPFTTSHAAADAASAAVLRDCGYVGDPSEPFGIYLQQELIADEPPARDGCTFTTMAEVGDLELRAEAHRVAWDGSTRNADDVAATMAQWPYRPDLDFIALNERGDPVGSAICWYDDSYEYGELEPVGVAATDRGRGIAAALLRFGLARLRDAGARHAVVGARGDDDYPVPRHLYASVGFEPLTVQQIVRKA